ncbi:glycerol-3-phosphate dehydrogenase/oxidase [Orrella daihaiensis]|uniref:Glycerol-3-phosphate dehydrogenase/oxidase n=1 Tax=Orrella daihaiensis TaxID=2782176 RepID=A0ABY4AMZ8_9BURK|nr:glycerol-3-phosphate dehydrogenase/oxidase [Orrella daihaiensis]UOD51704.1 glycerol-3-phosphate dehydrogenase/oxidase [Orrella daihaiensis]
MIRTAQWNQANQTDLYDITIIGGGATGLGVALDAALRGFSVLLLESHDFGGGTSSRSTKLLHGGVRYLAQGNISLVREALAERTTVLHIAPHLAQPLPFVMPSYQWWQTPFYGMGLKAYDLLAGKAGLGSTQLLSSREVKAALPGINDKHLQGGVQYWDGQFDDARLALALARSAERAGAVTLNYADVTAIEHINAGEAKFNIAVTDRRLGLDHHFKTRALINAAGVWVDQIRQMAQPATDKTPHHRMVSPSQGVHVVVDRSFMPAEHALLVPKTEDGRVLFAVPWMGSIILGTTDTPRQDLPREPDPFASELDFILQEASKVLSKPVTRDDIKSVWVGLRPLVATPAANDNTATKTLSREHTIVTDPNGLVTVTGGKWTTYRAMAEDVMDACFKAGILPTRPGGATRTHALVGAAQIGGQNHALWQPPGPHLYGSEIEAVQQCPGADHEIGLGLTEAMVRFAARHEYAQTIEDVLARRWRVLFLDAKLACSMAPEVDRILREETGLDTDLAAFEKLTEHYLP